MSERLWSRFDRFISEIERGIHVWTQEKNDLFGSPLFAYALTHPGTHIAFFRQHDFVACFLIKQACQAFGCQVRQSALSGCLHRAIRLRNDAMLYFFAENDIMTRARGYHWDKIDAPDRLWQEYSLASRMGQCIGEIEPEEDATPLYWCPECRLVFSLWQLSDRLGCPVDDMRHQLRYIAPPERLVALPIEAAQSDHDVHHDGDGDDGEAAYGDEDEQVQPVTVNWDVVLREACVVQSRLANCYLCGKAGYIACAVCKLPVCTNHHHGSYDLAAPEHWCDGCYSRHGHDFERQAREGEDVYRQIVSGSLHPFSLIPPRSGRIYP
jgi:hypothetical protein